MHWILRDLGGSVWIINIRPCIVDTLDDLGSDSSSIFLRRHEERPIDQIVERGIHCRIFCSSLAHHTRPMMVFIFVVIVYDSLR
jgi:hypothetical protein